MIEKRSYFGFQLIELLIVLSLVGILSAIAIPSYQNYLVRMHRASAVSGLEKLAIEMEKYAIEHNGYDQVDLTQLSFQNNEHYEYKLLSANFTGYSLIAIPNALQMERDKECGSLILTSTGEQKITGVGNVNDCF